MQALPLLVAAHVSELTLRVITWKPAEPYHQESLQLDSNTGI